jgi:hypothetical protein
MATNTTTVAFRVSLTTSYSQDAEIGEDFTAALRKLFQKLPLDIIQDCRLVESPVILSYAIEEQP